MRHLKAASSTAPLLLLFLFIIAAAAATARAQDNGTTNTTTTQTDVMTQQEERPQPTPTAPAKSVVRGRVIYDDTNRPVRRARILLLRSDGSGGMEKSGVTNERGEFQVQDLAAGSYFIMVDSPGIITPISSIELEDGMDERTSIAAVRKEFEEVILSGTNRVDLQIRARRGGVVTGRITYQDGDPVTSAQIIILRKKDNRLMRFVTGFSPYSMLSLRTDDRGVYRIAGLPPGEYVVGASETNTRDDARDEYAMMGLSRSSNFSVSYYQNETSLRQARTVKVEAGQEATEINITLIERAMYTVSGTVVARQSRTPVRAQVTILSKSESVALPFMDAGPSTASDEQGRWSFTNIPDGSYVIKVDPGEQDGEADVTETMQANAEAGSGRTAAAPPTTAPRRPALVPRQQDVTVSGADLSGVVIELGEGGRLQGTIMIEGGKVLPKEGSGVYTISLVPPDPGTGEARHGFVQPDGSFIIDKVPPGEFYVSMQQVGDRLYLKSATVGGTDLLREPVRMGPGTNIENVRITISTELATLQGRVVSASDAKPVRGSVILLVPSDPARWRSSTAYVPAVTAADGTFKVTTAPGSYLVLMVGEGELRSINEAFIKARSGGAKSVTLTAGTTETIELVAPTSKP